MNLYSFIENLKNVSLAHYDVNEFNCGDVYGIMNKKYHKYPCVVLTVDNIQKGQNDTNIVNGNLFYIDRQLADESNKLYIQSQGVSVLNNIFNKSYNNGGYPFDTQQFTPFSEKFADLCAGVYCTFSAIVESEDICDNGAYEPKSITITKNGIYDVVGYDEANVDIQPQPAILPNNTIFKNSNQTECPSFDYRNLTTAYQLFYYNTELVKIGEMLNTGNITDMSYMFSACSKLTSIPQLDTSNVTNMEWFCTFNTKVKFIPRLDTSNVTNMNAAFQYCGMVDFPTIITSKVMNIGGAFLSCSSLKNLGGFVDMGKAFNNGQMFSFQNSYLTNQSVQNIIDTVYDMNQNTTGGKATLKLKQTVIDAMTDTQKSQLAAKGWTLTN